MNPIRALLGVAWAEMRTARRLARTWLFTVLSLAGGLLAYFGLTMMQLVASSQSPSFGAFQPRFLIASVGTFVLWLFMIGLLFLAFDIRARDRRDRMTEVLDTRPVGNLALLTGRLVGLVTTVWLPMVLLIGLLQGFGMLAVALDLPVGNPLEPLSALAFLTIDALPMLMLWCAMVFLLAVVLRNRLAVAVAAVAVLGAHWWTVTTSPYYLLPAISGLTGYTAFPSDVQPVFATAADVAQRLAELLLAAGLLILAAVLHPRQDRAATGVQWQVAGVLLVLGVTVIGALAWQAEDKAALRDAWRAAHEARQHDPYADIDRVEGRVVIDPQRSLGLDLEYRLVAPEAPVDELVMGLNPGMVVAETAVNGNRVPHTHTHGLLVAQLPTSAKPSESIALSVRATGVPDAAFGYLDSALDVQALTSDAGNLLLLGTQTGVFDDAYVALMPAMGWLPMPGTLTGRDSPGHYARDYFTVDLEVRTPPEWLVAGPGLREGQAGEYRFRPGAPLPSVALLAARFERRVADVAGTRLELLMSPKHRRNVEFFAEAEEAIHERLARMFESADSLGLGYPYGGLSAVEVPAGLRAFGGGWRMASVQTMPGIVMLREYGFPASRFEFPFRDPQRFAARADGVAGAKADALMAYFDNDITGGNPFYGAVKNLLLFQTGAVGEGALALDAMLHEMALRMLTKSRNGYFSAYPFATGADLGAMMQQAFVGAVGGAVPGSAPSIAAQVRDGATRRATVWDAALGASLVDLDPGEDPRRALDVLWLKVPAIAQSVLDAYGREAVGSLLHELRRRYAGRNFTVPEFQALTAELGIPFGPVVGDWLHDAALPGFLASAPTVVRLPEDEQGRPRYQIRVHARNDEAVPGIVRLRANAAGGEGKPLTKATGQVVSVGGGEAVEIGLITRGPPEELWLQPVLALNRRDVRLPVPEVEEYEVVDAEPFSGFRASDWAPRETDGIVVDDLDEGFSVRYDDEDLGLRVGGGMSGLFVPDADIDQGLPVFSPFTATGASWTRQEVSESFGKYRHTTARAPAGDGRATGVFTAELPSAGRWRIDYHLPDASDAFFGARVRHGVYQLSIVASGVDEAVEFDAAVAVWGWNDLGTFELPAGEASVVVSNETSGRAVFADAVRWRPVNVD